MFVFYDGTIANVRKFNGGWFIISVNIMIPKYLIKIANYKLFRSKVAHNFIEQEGALNDCFTGICVRDGADYPFFGLGWRCKKRYEREPGGLFNFLAN